MPIQRQLRRRIQASRAQARRIKPRCQDLRRVGNEGGRGRGRLGCQPRLLCLTRRLRLLRRNARRLRLRLRRLARRLRLLRRNARRLRLRLRRLARRLRLLRRNARRLRLRRNARRLRLLRRNTRRLHLHALRVLVREHCSLAVWQRSRRGLFIRPLLHGGRRLRKQPIAHRGFWQRFCCRRVAPLQRRLPRCSRNYLLRCTAIALGGAIRRHISIAWGFVVLCSIRRHISIAWGFVVLCSVLESATTRIDVHANESVGGVERYRRGRLSLLRQLVRSWSWRHAPCCSFGHVRNRSFGHHPRSWNWRRAGHRPWRCLYLSSCSWQRAVLVTICCLHLSR